jgi:anthranilate 1,2-dioxygenase large subunit/terephthalate 1,2-dioxygenase oxygenase component alpha subunit
MATNQPILEWPAAGESRVPLEVMSNPEIYALEQERIFRGAAWHYLCLEIELPDAGSYRNVFVGETPVLVVRDEDGEIGAFINRCAHKGALLCVEPGGRRHQFTCLYHAWSYDLKGRLKSVAFQRGIGGKGGMPSDFVLDEHGLERLRVERFAGVVFGTFSEEVEALPDYLGPQTCAQFTRLFNRPIEVLGYHHQVLHNNWKLYMENVKDPYHASILHAFFTTFRLNRLTHDGGLQMEHDGWHHLSYSIGASAKEGAYEGTGIRSLMDDVGLEGPELLDKRQEFDDGVTITIQSIFPTSILQQIYNTLATRNIVPQGPDKAELHWTFFGYKDDDAALRDIRIKQSNLIGPAGYISMEDGMIGEYVQRGIAGSGPEAQSVIELGGRDLALDGSRVSESTVRGFWRGYRHLMGL